MMIEGILEPAAKLPKFQQTWDGGMKWKNCCCGDVITTSHARFRQRNPLHLTTKES
jgi:hypothetical protein